MHFPLVILNRTSCVINFLPACTRGVELKTINMATDNGGNLSQAPALKTPQTVKATKQQHFGFRNDKERDMLDKSKAVCKECQMELLQLQESHIATSPRSHVQATGPQQMKLKQILQLPSSSAHSLTNTNQIEFGSDRIES